MERQGYLPPALTLADIETGAAEMELSTFGTLREGFVQGLTESFGLGTVARDVAIPAGAPRAFEESLIGNPGTFLYGLAQRAIGGGDPAKRLDQEQYQKSPFFRKDIPWDDRMTEDRAAALASWYDARKVREQRLSQTPGWAAALVGNIAGQALDPINYVPFLGQAARGVAAARLGTVSSRALTASADAALNTAVAGVATAPIRGDFGDDVSFDRIALEVATAAVIGAAFGTAGGVLEARSIRRQQTALRNVTESHAALNDAVGSLLTEGEVRLTPETVGGLQRVSEPEIRRVPTLEPTEAYHGTIADFDRFDAEFLGRETEVASATRGFFFTSDPRVAEGYAAPYNPYEEGPLGRVMKTSVGRAYQVMNEALVKSLRGKGLKQDGQILRTKLEIENPKIIDREGREVVDAELDAALEQARAEGYDSVIFRNSRDPGYTDASDIASDVYVVFDPSKISIISKHKDAASAAAATDAPLPKLDQTVPPPEPPSADLQAAAKTASTPTRTAKELADEFKVDPESGAFDELDDIASLEAQERLPADEKARFDRATEIFQRSKTYADALQQAAICGMN